MDEERLASFLRSLEPELSPVLQNLYDKAHEDEVPIVRRETASFLRTMVCLTKPMRILEVGCAIGFSACLMAEAMPEGAKITTIEKLERYAVSARETFRAAGLSDRIELLFGDAAQVLPELSGPYDLIFLDAAKGQYGAFLPDIIRLLSVGGVLLTDNILQDGDLLEPRAAVRRRDRTIHSRMREFVYTCKHHPNLNSSLLPVGDGVMFSVRLS